MQCERHLERAECVEEGEVRFSEGSLRRRGASFLLLVRRAGPDFGCGFQIHCFCRWPCVLGFFKILMSGFFLFLVTHASSLMPSIIIVSHALLPLCYIVASTLIADFVSLSCTHFNPSRLRPHRHLYYVYMIFRSSSPLFLLLLSSDSSSKAFIISLA